MNVELPTNPDYDGAEIDEDGIISGSSWVMQLLTQVALGDDEEAWEFHRKFTELREQDKNEEKADPVICSQPD